MKIKIFIRTRLILSFLAIVLIIGVASTLIGIKVINDNVIGQAYDDVQTDLNTIRYFFNERVHFKMRFLEYLSYLETLRSAIIVNNRQMIAEKLREVKLEVEFDILTVTDSAGKVIVRSGNFNMHGDDVARDIYVKKVLATRKPCYGPDIITRDELLKEGRELADKVVINITPTPRARKIQKKVEDRALVLKAAAPVIHNGKLIGVIYGAKLINNSFDLVDKFRSLVFKDEKIDGSDLGTATIFLDDIRVSDGELLHDSRIHDATGGGAAFGFAPDAEALYLLEVRALVGDRELPWGPPMPVAGVPGNVVLADPVETTTPVG